MYKRQVVEHDEPWKVEETTQVPRINHGEMQTTSLPERLSGYLHFYYEHRDKSDRAGKKCQLLTFYRIHNKRMTRRTLLALLPVRNGKRLADGTQGR